MDLDNKEKAERQRKKELKQRKITRRLQLEEQEIMEIKNQLEAEEKQRQADELSKQILLDAQRNMKNKKQVQITSQSSSGYLSPIFMNSDSRHRVSSPLFQTKQDPIKNEIAGLSNSFAKFDSAGLRSEVASSSGMAIDSPQPECGRKTTRQERLATERAMEQLVNFTYQPAITHLTKAEKLSRNLHTQSLIRKTVGQDAQLKQSKTDFLNRQRLNRTQLKLGGYTQQLIETR